MRRGKQDLCSSLPSASPGDAERVLVLAGDDLFGSPLRLIPVDLGFFTDSKALVAAIAESLSAANYKVTRSLTMKPWAAVWSLR